MNSQEVGNDKQNVDVVLLEKFLRTPMLTKTCCLPWLLTIL